MFHTLLNKARKLVGLKTKLLSVDGFTGRGKIEFTSWKSGVKRLDVELRGVAGVSADVYIDDVLFKAVSLNNGGVDHTFDSGRGDDVPDLAKGAKVEIRQNGDVILSGGF